MARHSYTDAHGNVWEDQGDGYVLIHAETPEGKAAAWAEICAKAKQMKESADSFDKEFGL